MFFGGHGDDRPNPLGGLAVMILAPIAAMHPSTQVRVARLLARAR